MVLNLRKSHLLQWSWGVKHIAYHIMACIITQSSNVYVSFIWKKELSFRARDTSCAKGRLHTQLSGVVTRALHVYPVLSPKCSGPLNGWTTFLLEPFPVLSSALVLPSSVVRVICMDCHGQESDWIIPFWFFHIQFTLSLCVGVLSTCTNVATFIYDIFFIPLFL